MSDGEDAAAPAQVERKPRKEKPRMEAPPVLVPQPNEKEFEAKKKAHDDEVKRIEGRIATLEADILRMQNKGAPGNDPVAKLRAEKDAIRQRLKAIYTEKDELQALIKGFFDERSAVNDMAKQLSGGGGAAVQFRSLEDVEAKIKELEFEMQTSSLTLSEEKKHLSKIQQLQQGKKAVAALTQERARVSQLKEKNEMSREDLKTWQQELKSKTATLNDLREQEKEIDQRITALRESAPSMQALIDEKRKLQQEKREKGQAMKAEGDTFYEAKRARVAYDRLKMDWDYQERNDRYAKQRAERDAIRIEEEKLLAQNTVPQHPCAAELVICDDLVHHLKALLPKEEARDVQAFVPVATKDDKGKTLKPIGKIANDEGFFSAPAAKAKKTKKAEVPASEKLVHDFAVIGSFAKIKVSLPLTRGDVSACIAQIEQARAAFEARTEAEADAEERQPRAKAQGGAAEAFPVKVTVTATAPDRVDVKVSVKP